MRGECLKQLPHKRKILWSNLQDDDLVGSHDGGAKHEAAFTPTAAQFLIHALQ